jgi:hypothetical protein
MRHDRGSTQAWFVIYSLAILAGVLEGILESIGRRRK